MLQNGNLLRGTITQEEDRYHVSVDGGLIHVAAHEVLLTCRTLEEAYEGRRALIQPGFIRDHLNLAQWCQRHGLLESAAEQLAQARSIEPRHPMIPLIEQRIKTSLCRPEASTEPVQLAAPPPTPEELDRLVSAMPPGSVETFTQTIHPLLVNNCTAAGCHGPGSECKFRLLRPGRGKPATRRLTQRNLQSTLEWVDRDHPGASKLLTAPLEVHGSAEGPVFRDHQAEQYRRLVDWVYLVAQKSPPPWSLPKQPGQPILGETSGPSSVRRAVHAAAGPSGGRNMFQIAPGVVPRHVPLPSQRFSPGSTLLAPRAMPTPSGTDPAPASAPQPLPGADPFDPEVFNGRFFPERRPSDQGALLPRPAPPHPDRRPTGPPWPSATPPQAAAIEPLAPRTR